MPVDLTKLINKNLDTFAHMALEVVAKRVMADITKADRDDVLYSLIVKEVDRIDRSRTRPNEEAIDRMPLIESEQEPTKSEPESMVATSTSAQPSAPEEIIEPPSPTARPSPRGPSIPSKGSTSLLVAWIRQEREFLMDTSFALFDGGEQITYWEAEPAQYDMRYDALAKQHSGIGKTMQRLDRCRTNLRRLGATSFKSFMENYDGE